MRKHCNPKSANMVVSGGQFDDIESASAKLPSLAFAVTLAWRDNWPPRSRFCPWDSLAPMPGGRGGVYREGGWLYGLLAGWLGVLCWEPAAQPEGEFAHVLRVRSLTEIAGSLSNCILGSAGGGSARIGASLSGRGLR